MDENPYQAPTGRGSQSEHDEVPWWAVAILIGFGILALLFAAGILVEWFLIIF